MKNLIRTLSIAAALLIASTAFSQSTNWKVDTSKATIKIITSGPFGEVDGSLAGLVATIAFDDKNPSTGSFTATVDPKTINTGVSLRNTHLREKEEFFNTSKYPLISFKSKKIEMSLMGYTLTGDLTIKEVTKEIVIPFTFEKTDTGATFKGEFTMDAHDYTVGNSSKSVKVILEVPVTK